MKKALAWGMVAISTAGMIATQMGAVGDSEPRLVLQLSWAALFFGGLDALFITHND